jgi:hypothetical protein
MNTQTTDHFFRKTAFVLIAAALTALIIRACRPEPVEEERRIPAIVSLSALVDKHVDAIFSPLDNPTTRPENRVVLPSRHELRQLREFFADELPKATPSTGPLYQTAISLCDTLMATIDRRTEFTLRLDATRSVAAATRLDEKPQANDAGRASSEKAQHFEGAIRNDWEKSKQPYRARVDGLYFQLRAQERAFLNAPPASDNPGAL